MLFGRKKPPDVLRSESQPDVKAKATPSTNSDAKELEKLRSENEKLTQEVDKLRIALAYEKKKREALEGHAGDVAALEISLAQMQNERDILRLHLSDFQAQFDFFFDGIPSYAAEKWLERWNSLAPPPLNQRLELIEKNENEEFI